MRTVMVTVVVVMALAFTAAVGGAPPVAAAVSVSHGVSVGSPQEVAVVVAPQGVTVHPTWTRTCGWANCSVYFNKSETRIAAYGGALLTQLLCTMLRSTPAALVCTAISWAVGKAGDSAVSGGRCVKISFSRWTGLVYSIGTYTGSQCH